MDKSPYNLYFFHGKNDWTEDRFTEKKIKLIKPVMELKQLDDLKKTKLKDYSIAIFYFSNKEIDSNSMITHSLFGYEEGDAYEMIFSNGTCLEEESIDVFKDVLSIYKPKTDCIEYINTLREMVEEYFLLGGIRDGYDSRKDGTRSSIYFERLERIRSLKLERWDD